MARTRQTLPESLGARPLMARTLKPTAYHEAAAARAKAEAAAAKAKADLRKAELDEKKKQARKQRKTEADEKKKQANKSKENARHHRLKRAVSDETEKRCPLAQSPTCTASRHACACQPMADSRILPSARPTAPSQPAWMMTAAREARTAMARGS